MPHNQNPGKGLAAGLVAEAGSRAAAGDGDGGDGGGGGGGTKKIFSGNLNYKLSYAL